MLYDWLLSWTGSAVPALVGYGQLVEEVNLPSWLKNMYYDVIPGIPSIVGNAGCLAPRCKSLPNKYRLIKYGLTNKLFMNSYIMLLIMRD